MNGSHYTSFPPPKAGTWWIFALVGLLFIVYGIYAFTLPHLQPSHWADITSSEGTVQYIADNFRWTGMLSFMFGLLTIATSTGPFRQGQRWAWYSFLSFPPFFVFVIFFTWPGLMWSPLLIGSIIGLLLSRPTLVR